MGDQQIARRYLQRDQRSLESPASSVKTQDYDGKEASYIKTLALRDSTAVCTYRIATRLVKAECYGPRSHMFTYCQGRPFRNRAADEGFLPVSCPRLPARESNDC